MGLMNWIDIAWKIATWTGIMLAFVAVTGFATGCSSSNGWRFEIGVSPVTGLDNRAEFGKDKRPVNQQGAVTKERW